MITEGHQLKRSLLAAGILVVVLILSLFSAIPLLIHSQYVESLVSRSLEEQIGYTPSLGELRLSLFPVPVLHIDTIELKLEDDQNQIPLLHAEHAVFRPSLMGLLFGQPVLAHVEFKNADLHFPLRGKDGVLIKVISLQDLSLDFWNISSNKPIRFRAKGRFLSDQENLDLSGTFQTDFKHFDPRNLKLQISTEIGPISLTQLGAWWGGALPIQMGGGTVSFSGNGSKERGTAALSFDGRFQIDDLIYEGAPGSLPTTAADYEAKFLIHYDLETSAFVMKQGLVTAPFSGPIEMDTQLNMKTGEVEEFILRTDAIHLDLLPQYLPVVASALPVNVGLSGESQIDFLMTGSPEIYQMNFRSDLTNATLAYSQFFSKERGIPLQLSADLKLVAGQVLRGDLSIEFGRAIAKGSLVGVDLSSGNGEITFLTNKFDVQGWEQYFPIFSGFQFSGALKILASAKGNIKQPKEMRMMSNISLDDLSAKTKAGSEIKHVSGSLDFGSLDAELKGLQAEIGASEFQLEGKMFSQPEPRWLISVESSKVNAADLMTQLQGLQDAIHDERWKIPLDAISDQWKFFLSGDAVEKIQAKIAFEKGRILIPEGQLDVFGGTLSVRAAFDFNTELPTSVIELEADRLNLAKMYPPESAPILYGNLFAAAKLNNEGPLDSGWLDRLKGSGAFSVTNGEMHTLDLLGGLGQIPELAPLNGFKSGVTRFSDLRSDFKLENKKLTTENLFLVSDDVQVEGAGDLTLGGGLNFSLAVYLSPNLSQTVSSRIPGNVRLGPIPILVVGSLKEPSIRTDPMLIASFIGHLVQDQFSKITSRLMPYVQPPPPVLAGEEGRSKKERHQKGGGTSLDETLFESSYEILKPFISKKEPPSGP